MNSTNNMTLFDILQQSILNLLVGGWSNAIDNIDNDVTNGDKNNNNIENDDDVIITIPTIIKPNVSELVMEIPSPIIINNPIKNNESVTELNSDNDSEYYSECNSEDELICYSTSDSDSDFDSDSYYESNDKSDISNNDESTESISYTENIIDTPCEILQPINISEQYNFITKSINKSIEKTIRI